MPRKTLRDFRRRVKAKPGFNEAAARCRGKPSSSGAPAGNAASLQ